MANLGNWTRPCFRAALQQFQRREKPDVVLILISDALWTVLTFRNVVYSFLVLIETEIGSVHSAWTLHSFKVDGTTKNWQIADLFCFEQFVSWERGMLHCGSPASYNSVETIAQTSTLPGQPKEFIEHIF